MDLVDTDVLIDVQRGHAPALVWFAALRELPAVPGFVVLELVQDARNAREVRQAMKLVGGGPMVAEMVGSRPRSVTLPLAGRSDAVAAGEGTYQRYPTGADLGSDRE